MATHAPNPLAPAFSPLAPKLDRTQDEIDRRLRRNKAVVLIVTFLTYTSFHLSRRPTAIVKPVLHPNNHKNDSGWAPFNSTNFSKDRELVGALDSAFLFAYAAAMFVSGHIGDRFNLRRFLFLGMVGSGTFCILFGLAHAWNITDLWYFIVVQVCAGICQSSGWPSVVAIVGNWFGKGNRGLIMGIWNSHTSVGNILGSVIGGAALGPDDNQWWMVFYISGAIIAGMAFLVLAVLPVSPEEVGLPSPYSDQESKHADVSSASFQAKLLDPDANDHFGDSARPDADSALSIVQALRIPGVANFAACLFFCKLVAYTFLYWLPFYIHHQFPSLPTSKASDFSTLMDIGGVAGGIAAGFISDRYQASALTSCAFLLSSGVMMLVYRNFGNSSVGMNLLLMFFLGVFVNGPYALITTAVSADLGTHRSLKGNSKALATVTAIIDGTGSVGAAIGPLLAGVMSTTGTKESEGWNNVFYMCISAACLASVLLLHLVSKEVTVLMGWSTSDSKQTSVAALNGP